MKNTRKAKHPSVLETVYETAASLYDAEIINATTMREFKTLCLPKVNDLTPRQIKNIRLKEKVSQQVFARCLNTTLSTVRQWEQGDKHPRGASLKLLNLVADKGLNVLLS